MAKKYDFAHISMKGRAAYTVMCAERYALAKYPNKDWKPLFAWMWQVTSDYFDEWYYRFMEILPENIYEFDSFKADAFDYLTEDQYYYYSKFLRDIDENMAELIKIPTDISMVYCYTSIPGKGKESIDLVNKAIKILEDNGIDLPDLKSVEFSQFSLKDG